MQIISDSQSFFHECFEEDLKVKIKQDLGAFSSFFKDSNNEATDIDYLQAKSSNLQFSGWDYCLLERNAKTSQYDRLVARRLEQENRRIIALARTGSGFHGQGKNLWVSPPGNLYFSASLSTNIEAKEAMNAIVLPALACMESLRKLSSTLALSIKWINDILLFNRKLAGVLASIAIQEGRIRRIHIGIGINLASSPQLSETPFVPPCALHTYENISLARVFSSLSAELLLQLKVWEEGGASILLDKYLEHSYVRARRVQLFEYNSSSPQVPIIQGRVKQIHRDLSLELEGSDERFSHVKLKLLDED